MLYQHYDFESSRINPRTYEHMNIQPLYITCAQYSKQWQSIMHSHPFTEIFFITDEFGKFNIEGSIHNVKSNDLIVINPNIMHTEFNDGKKPLKYFVIGIYGLAFQSDFSSQNGYYICNLSDYRNEIMFYLNTILNEMRGKEKKYEQICFNLLEAFLLLLNRLTDFSFNIVSGGKDNKARRECRFIEQYIDEHFSEHITLDSLSSLTYLDKYHLIHVFKKYKGDSPIHYLNKRRIKEAKYLLETTDYSSAKIAQYTGFSSQSYFTQAFRKELGLSPSQYRKNLTEIP